MTVTDTAPAVDARRLKDARDALGQAVDALCAPGRIAVERIERGTGTVVRERIEVQSTLAALVEAVAPSGDGRGGMGRGGGSPIDLAALDLLDRIRVGVADWLSLVGLAEGRRELSRVAPRTDRRRDSAPERGLRQLRTHGWADPAQPEQLARIVRGWAAEGRAVMGEPPEYRDIRGVDCPECGYALWEDVWTGEAARPIARVRVWPLRVEVADSGHVRGVWCRACWAAWWRGADMSELAIAIFHTHTYGPIPRELLDELAAALGGHVWTEEAEVAA